MVLACKNLKLCNLFKKDRNQSEERNTSTVLQWLRAKLHLMVVKHAVSYETHCSQILLTTGREIMLCLVVATGNFTTFNVKN